MAFLKQIASAIFCGTFVVLYSEDAVKNPKAYLISVKFTESCFFSNIHVFTERMKMRKCISQVGSVKVKTS